MMSLISEVYGWRTGKKRLVKLLFVKLLFVKLLVAIASSGYSFYRKPNADLQIKVEPDR